ncbi:MAG: GTPase HflX [Desulfobulbaceae bacterium]|nr:GTPase HflX [Desulfobulbaceae bacterium]
MSADDIIGRDLARSLCTVSAEINRQVGLLVHRSGKIESVIVGDHDRIVIPPLSLIRTAGGRLRGLRCIHTCFNRSGLNDEDIMDMVCLRLDLMAVMTMNDGLPDLMFTAHLVPEPVDGRDWAMLEPMHPSRQPVPFLSFIEDLEEQFVSKRPIREVEKGFDRAILVSVTTGAKNQAAESLAELAELARSADVIVLDRVIQRRKSIHPRFILGKGKLMEIMLRSLHVGANLLIFDQELTPSQIRSVTEHTELRVIDRTQLILDIFARRALSREGKLQIEMAQLKYLLPRLSTRDDALSRLTGGIGARGPGETRLEIDRRRINDRIARLTRELKSVGRERYYRRSRRRKKDVPVISLVGYTNAGKSTLLNTLTRSTIKAEDLLFATLDPTSRRLRFPRDMEVIITDTVGFIRNLPADLLKAFESTLEELHEADLLVHVIDVSNSAYREQVEVVEKLLRDLELDTIPCLRVFNKIDRVDQDTLDRLAETDGILISAIDEKTLAPFLEQAGDMLQSMIELQPAEGKPQ